MLHPENRFCINHPNRKKFAKDRCLQCYRKDILLPKQIEKNKNRNVPNIHLVFSVGDIKPHPILKLAPKSLPKVAGKTTRNIVHTNADMKETLAAIAAKSTILYIAEKSNSVSIHPEDFKIAKNPPRPPAA